MLVQIVKYPVKNGFRLVLIQGCLLVLLMSELLSAGDPRIVYPETCRVEQVDVYHGVEVADPYRWLENDVREDPQVEQWVEAQNQVTFGYLKEIQERESLRQRLTDLWDYQKYSAPFKEGGRYYFFKNDGLQNQSVLYLQKSLDEKPQVLIDPNTWSEDGTIALAGTSFSDDGRYVAYGIAEAGSDWRTWKIMEIESRRVLDDELRWIKFSRISWTRDSRGFFYSRYSEPQEGEEFQSLNLNHKLYYHRLGTAQADDVLVYKRPDQPKWSFFGEVTEDGRYLIITVGKGTDRKYRVLVKDLDEPYGMPVELIDHFRDEYSLIGNDGHVLYFQTDLDAPRGRVIAIDLHKQPAGRQTSSKQPLQAERGQTESDQEQPAEAEPAKTDKLDYQEVIPQAEQTLSSVSLLGNCFVASYLQDAHSVVKLFSVDGQFVRDIELPGLGSASGFSGRRSDTETFYLFSSFATPPSTYRYNLITGQSTLLRRAEVEFDPDDYEVKQVFYNSKDGTKVPMFLTCRKGLTLDGNNHTLLYGYGGFNIPLTPRFSVARLAWLELGGVLAVANLRGGGEYGEQWHQAGTRLNKQNVFDDFIAAAEWLIEQKYTQPAKLAIEGGSNGGLLVGAVMTQRPELFGAALPAVGVMDMLRFHQFTAGRFWVDDYGSAEDPQQFRALYAYSPYHNLKPGVVYPPTLVTTADTDDRVVPGHSFKFAARLQKCHAGEGPVLIRIETRAGHGAGKPTAKVIQEQADKYAFLLKTLKIDLGQQP